MSYFLAWWRKERTEYHRNTMKVGIVAVYFGPLPNYFPLWVDCVKRNASIDFILFTDQIVQNEVPNLNVQILTFNELKSLFMNKLSIENLDFDPYKLCDFKPAYGHLFENYLIKYDYWGYCDLDIFFGDIRSAINSKLGVYDKIFDLGHLSIYRNDEVINVLYNRTFCGLNIFNNVIQARSIKIFDESYFGSNVGINGLMLAHNFKLYGRRRDFSDIKPFYRSMIDIFSGEEAYYELVDNEILMHTPGNIDIVLYVHFQKRRVIHNDAVKVRFFKDNQFVSDLSDLRTDNSLGSSSLTKYKWYRDRAKRRFLDKFIAKNSLNNV